LESKSGTRVSRAVFLESNAFSRDIPVPRFAADFGFAPETKTTL